MMLIKEGSLYRFRGNGPRIEPYGFCAKVGWVARVTDYEPYYSDGKGYVGFLWFKGGENCPHRCNISRVDKRRGTVDQDHALNHALFELYFESWNPLKNPKARELWQALQVSG